jgi:uncharacterized protein (TIRG00374 family)
LLYLLFTRMVDVRSVWAQARGASMGWLAVALGLYLVMVLISAWRWRVLLEAQHVHVPFGTLFRSFLVAFFFNNFLPSNIGGDVVRIADTARAAGSKTLATTVVLIDRGAGLLGLVFVAAVGSTCVAESSVAVGPIGPGILWAILALAIAGAAPFVMMPERVGRLLSPLRVLHQEWVEERLNKFTIALAKFKAAPQALAAGFGGAILVQATLVGFYAAILRSMHVAVPITHLAILVPVSFIVQMVPLSINGLGLREGTFQLYFSRLGLHPNPGVTLSLIGAALMMLFSIAGAVAYLTRRH